MDQTERVSIILDGNSKGAKAAVKDVRESVKDLTNQLAQQGKHGGDSWTTGFVHSLKHNLRHLKKEAGFLGSAVGAVLGSELAHGFKESWKESISTAMAGLYFGAKIGGPVGGLVGAGVGALAGLGLGKYNEIREARKAVAELRQELNLTTHEATSLFEFGKESGNDKLKEVIKEHIKLIQELKEGTADAKKAIGDLFTPDNKATNYETLRRHVYEIANIDNEVKQRQAMLRFPGGAEGYEKAREYIRKTEIEGFLHPNADPSDRLRLRREGQIESKAKELNKTEDERVKSVLEAEKQVGELAEKRQALEFENLTAEEKLTKIAEEKADLEQTYSDTLDDQERKKIRLLELEKQQKQAISELASEQRKADEKHQKQLTFNRESAKLAKDISNFEKKKWTEEEIANIPLSAAEQKSGNRGLLSITGPGGLVGARRIMWAREAYNARKWAELADLNGNTEFAMNRRNYAHQIDKMIGVNQDPLIQLNEKMQELVSKASSDGLNVKLVNGIPMGQ